MVTWDRPLCPLPRTLSRTVWCRRIFPPGSPPDLRDCVAGDRVARVEREGGTRSLGRSRAIAVADPRDRDPRPCSARAAASGPADERGEHRPGLAPLAALHGFSGDEKPQRRFEPEAIDRASHEALRLRAAAKLPERLGVADPTLDRIGRHLDETLELLPRVLVLSAREQPSRQVRARGGEARVDLERGAIVTLGLLAPASFVGQHSEPVVGGRHIGVEIARLQKVPTRLLEVAATELD